MKDYRVICEETVGVKMTDAEFEAFRTVWPDTRILNTLTCEQINNQYERGLITAAERTQLLNGRS